MGPVVLQLNTDVGVVVTTSGDRVTLTRSERAVLDLLSRNPGRVVTRDQILDGVSEQGSDRNDRNVDFLINRLRRKLGDDARAPRYIATRYGEGYVWIADAPLGVAEVAQADVVVGPVLGLDHVPDRAAAERTARELHVALAQAFGAETRVVYAPDCPPPEDFRGAAPRHAAELSFFADRGRTDCVVAIREFRTGRIVAGRRIGMEDIAGGRTGIDAFAREMVDDLWRTQIAEPRRGSPLPVALFAGDADQDGPPEPDPALSNRRLVLLHQEEEARSLRRWRQNEDRLRGLLARSPDDPELKVLTALAIHSRYVMAGPGLFARGIDTRAEDEDEVERFVTEALPHVRSSPDHAIVAGKLLHFLRRGYEDLAHDLCERAAAESLSVANSLAVVGQMRSFFGDTEGALGCLDQAIGHTRAGSHAHLYALVIKCQALAAAGRWDALHAALRDLSAASRIAGFVLGPLFCDPEAPPMSARAMAYLLSRRRAGATLLHKHYVGARLFLDEAHAANSLRAPVRVLTDRFGPDVVPQEVQAAHPALFATAS